jgi:hypothetical protein
MICGPRGHLSRRSLLKTAGGVAFFGTLAGQLAAAAESPGGDSARPQ